ncbi:priB protein [Rhizoctonia solani AG-3 Rhs1AP]|uniref:PriB protein n=2 Tax=Rhizoctonia solani AG-3 TaxID=1086053 RepID=A0A074RZ70_9AGAM|nr:priB protein [Rhizoctonia solani AG-3 Rhs1AP]KEP50610.1 priB protein [Rhizoctonia solani 123E]
MEQQHDGSVAGPSGSPDADDARSSRPQVQRGARACTVCRQAKMRCIGAEDGQAQCQRCKRSNLECVFEKHRRGRKPGSKLSEASKMLRRIEKGLNNERKKSQVANGITQAPYPVNTSRPNDFNFASNSDGFLDPSLNKSSTAMSASTTPTSADLPSGSTQGAGSPGKQGTQVKTSAPASPSQTMDADDDDEDEKEPSDDGLFPARLLARENRRNSFFRTILNPAEAEGGHSPDDQKPSMDSRQTSVASNITSIIPMIPEPKDPIAAGLMDEAQAKVLFDLVFLRLNPFINLFDPVLHTVPYVRSRCPFLFTCLIMAGCKFWKPELFKQTQRIANEFVVKAFTDQWKRVEVVQAFACMTYWKEPEDTRTYTYIGYASRMAVELGLNRYLPKPPEGETELQKRERRNRERTYLVLFVHDRSLAMQTGRQWMLPECDLVRHSLSWHEDNFIRPEDVIICAFVQLRRIAAETTDVFYLHKGTPGLLHADVNYEILLRGCNSKLTQWMDLWHGEMKKAGGQMFHFSMLTFFRLHVRLFLNSFGLQSSMASSTRASASLHALSACYTSAVQTLQIVTSDFAPVGMLRYGQDSITVMTAYSAVFLLKLLRRPQNVTDSHLTPTLSDLDEGASTQKIYDLISNTADAYQEAAIHASSSGSAAYHARFLRSLVAKDMASKARQSTRERKPKDNSDAMSVGGTSQGTPSQASPSYTGDPVNAPPSYHPPLVPGTQPSTMLPVQTPPAVGGAGMPNSNGLMYQQQPGGMVPYTDDMFPFPSSPHLPMHPAIPQQMNEHNQEMQHQQAFGNGMQMQHQQPHPQMLPHHQQHQHQHQSNNPQYAHNMYGNMQTATATASDQHYWRNMFIELGFGGPEPTVTSYNNPMM